MYIAHQKEIVKKLKNNIFNKKLANTYLFSGNTGMGKMKIAIDFAKSLNCEKNNIFTECSCKNCKEINLFKHPDIDITGPIGKDIKIEQIKEIQEKAKQTPYSGKYRIFIIKDAEKMNEYASNCILKTIEEPENFNIFLLLTEDKKAIIETIYSRSRVIEFLEKNNDRLDIFENKTNIGITEEQWDFLTSISNGDYSDLFKSIWIKELLFKQFNSLKNVNIKNLQELKDIYIKEIDNISTEIENIAIEKNLFNSPNIYFVKKIILETFESMSHILDLKIISFLIELFQKRNKLPEKLLVPDILNNYLIYKSFKLKELNEKWIENNKKKDLLNKYQANYYEELLEAEAKEFTNNSVKSFFKNIIYIFDAAINNVQNINYYMQPYIDKLNLISYSSFLNLSKDLAYYFNYIGISRNNTLLMEILTNRIGEEIKCLN